MTVQEIKDKVLEAISLPISAGTLNINGGVSVARRATFVRFNSHDPSSRTIELAIKVEWLTDTQDVIKEFTKEHIYRLSNKTLFDTLGNLVYMYSQGVYINTQGEIVAESDIEKENFLTEYEYWHYAMAYTTVMDAELILLGMLNLDNHGFFN